MGAMIAPGRAARLLPLLLLCGAAQAPAQAPEDTRAAVEVVMKQLEAFRQDDFDTAYTFASRELKHVWDRHGFETMVRRGYPEIARSTYAFIAHARRGDGGYLYLAVKIGGANGNKIEALYEMVWEDGRWKINGVVTKPDTGESVSVPPGGLRDAATRATALRTAPAPRAPPG